MDLGPALGDGPPTSRDGAEGRRDGQGAGSSPPGYLDLPLGPEPESSVDVGFAPPSDPKTPRRESPRPAPKRRGFPTWLLALLVLGLPLAAGLGYFLKPDPALAALSADLVDFSSVPLGNSARQEIRLVNQGESDLVLEAMGLVGEEAIAFSILDEQRCQGRPLAAAAECSLGLTYAPKAAGPSRARLWIRTNSTLAEMTIPLLGEGIAPELRAGPALLDFGEQTVGFQGERQQIQLENRGAAPLTVASVDLRGLAAADFVSFEDRCSQAKLDPGKTCSVGFEFFPTSEGERRAVLDVRSNAAPVAEPPVLIGLGLAQEPLLAVDPPRLDFGQMRLEEAGEAKKITLTNEGNGPLEIRTVGIAVPGAGDSVFDSRPEKIASSFPLEDLGCAGSRLDPGSSCELRLLFLPRLEGAVGAAVEIEHSAGPVAHRVPLVGQGTAPHASLSASSVAFGEIPRGQSSPWRRLSIENTGSAALLIEELEIRGSDRRSFESSASGCLQVPIDPGQSCSAEVRFRARREGPHRAELMVRHNADGGVEKLALNGIGTSARLNVSPSRLDFGNVRVSEDRHLEIRLSNSGRADLRIQRLSIEGESGGEIELDQACANTTLSPRSSCTVGIRFEPKTVGARRARLMIEHDADTEPYRVALEAAALPRPEPAIRITPERLDFPDRPVGDRSSPVRLRIENPGEAELELTDISVEGVAAADFELLPGSCGRSLGPGSQCTVDIAFEPRREGERQAALVILHNAGGGALRLLLLGHGEPPADTAFES